MTQAAGGKEVEVLEEGGREGWRGDSEEGTGKRDHKHIHIINSFTEHGFGKCLE